MRDPRCVIGWHKWVGKRRARDQQATSLWDETDEAGYVVWCKRCGKDRGDALRWGMAGGGGGID